MRSACHRFGHYEVIDFLAVLFGYEILGERTLSARVTTSKGDKVLGAVTTSFPPSLQSSTLFSSFCQYPAALPGSI
jgi:hypothetical protein